MAANSRAVRSRTIVGGKTVWGAAKLDGCIHAHCLRSRLPELRAGVLQTRRGAVETPIFMPVGTQGNRQAAVSPVGASRARGTDHSGNTYHLQRPAPERSLSPGKEWPAQIHGVAAADTTTAEVSRCSLWPELRKITEEGVISRTIWTALRRLIGPERLDGDPAGFGFGHRHGFR